MRAARIYANQPVIVLALRKLGVSVQHLHSVGAGCPDLLCAIAGHTFLIEVKDGSKPQSKQALTPDQDEWHTGWRADVYIVNSIEKAIAIVQFYKEKAA